MKYEVWIEINRLIPFSRKIWRREVSWGGLVDVFFINIKMEANHSDLEVDPNLAISLQSMRDAAKRVYLATFKIDDVIFCMKTCR